MKNERYTIAMARTSYPHSATSQFYINVADNDFLNADQASDGNGYCVFGTVVKGADVVDKIAAVRTTTRRGMNDVPVDVVKIVDVKSSCLNSCRASLSIYGLCENVGFTLKQSC